MSRKRIKQYLMLLLAIGVIAVVASGSGTFASFNAQVTNPGNTFAAGTLFLHNTGHGTTCTSESANSTNGGMNVNPGTGTGGDVCDVLFPNVDLTAGGNQTADLTLTDAGTLPASNIKFRINNCTVGTNQTATGSSVTFGTAPTCGDFYITIQEKTTSGFSADAFCAYGPGTLTTTCASPDNTKTLFNSSSFTNLQMDNGAGSATAATLTASGGATDTRYYRITISPNVGSGNSLQNRKLSFDMDWQINS